MRGARSLGLAGNGQRAHLTALVLLSAHSLPRLTCVQRPRTTSHSDRSLSSDSPCLLRPPARGSHVLKYLYLGTTPNHSFCAALPRSSAQSQPLLLLVIQHHGVADLVFHRGELEEPGWAGRRGCSSCERPSTPFRCPRPAPAVRARGRPEDEAAREPADASVAAVALWCVCSHER